jgi:hypothetical protein
VKVAEANAKSRAAGAAEQVEAAQKAAEKATADAAMDVDDDI